MREVLLSDACRSSGSATNIVAVSVVGGKRKKQKAKNKKQKNKKQKGKIIATEQRKIKEKAKKIHLLAKIAKGFAWEAI